MTIIAIDGGTRTGKTSTAKRVARRLELPHISTGLIYRALAWGVLELGLDPTNADDCAQVAYRFGDSSFDFIDGNHVSWSCRLLGPDLLRGTEVTAASSLVAVHPEVRALLLGLQRQAASDGAVVEGRDIGTVVLPDANLKVFLTVSLEEHRRRAQLQGAEAELDLERDQREATRAVAPMVAAKDAYVIDTSTLKKDEVANIIIDLCATPVRLRPLGLIIAGT